MSLAQPLLGTSMHHTRRRCSKACKCCSQKEAIWKQCLEADTHGCAVCLNVLTEDNWHATSIRDHKANCRDLVCPQCSVRGYAPYRYDSFQCTICLERFGSGQFLPDKVDLRHSVRHVLPRGKRARNADLVCKQCRPVMKCSRCGEGYEDAYWTEYERMCHRRQQTKLVCKPCRSQGFHPRNVVSYTCKSCKGKFGSRKFSSYQIANFIQDNYKVLTCMQCVAEAKQEKTAGSTSAASFAGKKIDR